jgi:hypothetical protein
MATCFPLASGVPAQPGAPQWWAPGNVPRPYSTELNDPRWRGAVRRGYNNGASVEGVFRGLHMIEGANPVLYMSLQVFDDPSPGTDADAVYVGLANAAGTTAYIIHVPAYSAIPPGGQQAGPTGGPTSYQWNNATSTWSSIPGTPTWLNDRRSWLTIDTASNPDKYSWAVNLRVPTKTTGGYDNDGINIGTLTGGGTFRFWYALIKDLDDFVAAYYWPRTGAEITISGGGQNVYPNPTTVAWDTAQIGSGAGCGTGISLSAWDIGTTNTDPMTGLPAPHQIHVRATPPPPPLPVNHLYAKPLNQTGGDITPNSLSATFRTANWGSAADFTFAAGATPWEEVLPGTTKDNGAATTTNGNKASIEFDWTISTTDAADWIPPGGSKWTHQCMLVTLSGAYDFLNDSAYRNMDFVQASEFERDAQISIQGLKKLPDGGSLRDVYVYVSRSNMPHELREPQRPPDLREAIALVERQFGGPVSRTHVDEKGRAEPSEFDLLASYVPTIRYSVFHTTAGKINVAGKVKPVVQEQTAFGYFVLHEGDVYGWDAKLGGDFEAQKASGIFKLKVREGGKVVIRTKVRGWEEKPPPDRGPEIEPGPPQPEDGRRSPISCLGRVGQGGAAALLLLAITKAVRR